MDRPAAGIFFFVLAPRYQDGIEAFSSAYAIHTGDIGRDAGARHRVASGWWVARRTLIVLDQPTLNAVPRQEGLMAAD